MSIQKKLIGLIGVSSVGLLIVSTLAIWSFTTITKNFEDVMNSHINANRAIQRSLLFLDEANSSFISSMVVDEPKELENIRNFEADYNHSMLQYEMFMHAIKSGNKSEEFKKEDGGILYAEWVRLELDKSYSIPPSNQEINVVFEDMEPFIHGFLDESQAALALKKQTLRSTQKNQEAQDLLESHIEEARKNKTKVSELTNKFLELDSKGLDQELVRLNHFTTSIYRWVLILLIINLSVVFIFGIFYVRRIILRPIENLTKVVNDISIGKLDVKIDPQTLRSKDELGKLAQAFDRTIVSLKLAMREQSKDQEVKTGSDSTSDAKSA